MKILSFALLLYFSPNFTHALASTDSLLLQLDKAIEKRSFYLQDKLSRIELHKIDARGATNPATRFLFYTKIYEEYKSFIYDSAFAYARRMQGIALQLSDVEKLSDSKIKMSFVLVSAGLFHEALDTLQTIKAKLLPTAVRTEFYYLMARTCYDLSDFNQDNFYSLSYTLRGHRYVDSALAIQPKNSSLHFLLKGLKSLRLGVVDTAKIAFENMLKNFPLSDPEFAVAASTLSFIYFYTYQPDQAKEMLIKAAIADMRASTKETLATLNLADMLFKEGDVERAYNYIKVAMEDANYYGARHRKIQVAAVFPIIEGKMLSLTESRRKMLLVYSSAITLLALAVLLFAFIIYKQFKRLQEAKRIISASNDILTETNHQLTDATKIKEEYIWYYFTTTAEYITKLENLKKSLDLRLMTKRIDETKFIVDSINIKREREELYHNFDATFLKLFPDFVSVFNSLFNPDDQILLKDGQLLNTELRIFALIRMGIHDHEKIAKILDYSVTTIYTYKTRLRNKSIVPNEDFERQIMSIRAI